jgi:glutamyl-tRNA synthetase
MGAGEETWAESKPKHKKNPEVGTKTTTFGPKLVMEQEDAQSFDDNEEVRFPIQSALS